VSTLKNQFAIHRALALLVAVASLAVSGADVSYFGVIKSIQCLQTNESYAPTALASNGYSFTAFAVAATNGVLTNATVKPGSSAVRALAPTTNDTFWIYPQSFDTQSALDAAYPPGTAFSQVNYAVTLSATNDGLHTALLNFFLFLTPLSYPAAPRLTDLAAAQAVDTTADFTLDWNGLGGSSLTIVQLTVMDASSNVLFMTPAPLQTGALNGSATSARIPAYTLPPGGELIGHLTVANPGLPNTSSYPGATGVAALATDTQFPLTTRPAPAPPGLEVLPPQAGQFQLQLTGETNRIYQILASTNLLGWTNLFTTNCPSGRFQFTDTNSPSHSARLYRAKVGQ